MWIRVVKWLKMREMLSIQINGGLLLGQETQMHPGKNVGGGIRFCMLPVPGQSWWKRSSGELSKGQPLWPFDLITVNCSMVHHYLNLHGGPEITVAFKKWKKYYGQSCFKESHIVLSTMAWPLPKFCFLLSDPSGFISCLTQSSLQFFQQVVHVRCPCLGYDLMFHVSMSRTILQPSDSV